MRLSVKAEIEQRRAVGNFFTKDPTKTMMQNALDAVEWLADEGAKQARARMPVDKGFTRDNIEGFTYKRVQMVTGRDVQSRFGKTRLKPDLSRAPGSAAYPAKRRPYITLNVIESGGYGGSRGADLSRSEARSRMSSRTTWTRGTRQGRRAHWVIRNTYRRMKAYERAIRFDLTKGLN